MMKHLLFAVCLTWLGSSPAVMANDEPVQLKREDLKPLVGSWELKSDLKTAVRVRFTLHKEDGKTDDFAMLRYDYTAEGFIVKNAPAAGISVAGFQHRKRTLLVASMDRRSAPFKPDLREDVIAEYQLVENQLTLNVAKSSQIFVPKSLRESKALSEAGIKWEQLVWVKVKE